MHEPDLSHSTQKLFTERLVSLGSFHVEGHARSMLIVVNTIGLGSAWPGMQLSSVELLLGLFHRGRNGVNPHTDMLELIRVSRLVFITTQAHLILFNLRIPIETF